MMNNFYMIIKLVITELGILLIQLFCVLLQTMSRAFAINIKITASKEQNYVPKYIDDILSTCMVTNPLAVVCTCNSIQAEVAEGVINIHLKYKYQEFRETCFDNS